MLRLSRAGIFFALHRCYSQLLSGGGFDVWMAINISTRTTHTQDRLKMIKSRRRTHRPKGTITIGRRVFLALDFYFDKLQHDRME